MAAETARTPLDKAAEDAFKRVNLAECLPNKVKTAGRSNAARAEACRKAVEFVAERGIRRVYWRPRGSDHLVPVEAGPDCLFPSQAIKGTAWHRLATPEAGLARDWLLGISDRAYLGANKHLVELRDLQKKAYAKHQQLTAGTRGGQASTQDTQGSKVRRARSVMPRVPR
jgi:hypothetical protein